ncbi:MAG: hypothetical protein E4H17_03730 [Gemmatimonadales bacterium]|nr:MAG: hypothetical protein E4H17_03730 [Gemmatimonadales bacterium]
MLYFDVYRNGTAAGSIDLAGAYAFGQDEIPMRSELTFSDGRLACNKRTPGPAGVALLWEAPDMGRLLLPTTRLSEQDKPYNLNIELARAQMMRIAQKREDWGLFDYPSAEPLMKEFDEARVGLVDALRCTDPAEASVLADAALAKGLLLGEKIALVHADVFISRRLTAGAGPRGGFGCSVDPGSATGPYQGLLRDSFDYISVPMSWKRMEPKERSYDYEPLDAWMMWATRNRKMVHAGPLLCLCPGLVPDWLFLWENDYPTLKDVIYEHIQQTVKRYERQVHVWKVASGLHAFNPFNLNFEQIMELTRMSCLLVKKLVPSAQVVIVLVMPFSEYYARNVRTVPPMLYADMAVQSGVKFDAFAVQLCMGVPSDGLFVRDLLQISSMLDGFLPLGKPLHISGCQVPSDVSDDGTDHWEGKLPVYQAGHWQAPWSQELQARWLASFNRIALSKPFVESTCWRDLADGPGHYVPHGGLCQADLSPKLAYDELRNFRSQFIGASKPNR